MIIQKKNGELNMKWCNSSTGDLYEYDKSSRPSWKKHIQSEETAKDGSLKPLLGCTIHGMSGDYSVSLFLLTKVICVNNSYSYISPILRN